MIHTGKLLRAELYDKHTYPYTNVKAVYDAHKGKHPGKLIVTNAHWFDPGPKPIGNYKVNGEVISRQYNSAIGFRWSGNERPIMGWSDMSGKDNFLSTIAVLVGGVRQDVSNQTAGVRRSCLRTWWGFDGDGNCTVEVTTTNYTLDAIIDRMVSLGIVDGLVLDGSGSSQCYDGTVHQKGDGRTIYSFLLLWFDDGKSGGNEGNTLTIRDANLSWAYALTSRTKTTEIILHHAAADGSVEAVHQSHLARGWAGIAYHYYVRKDGTIWRGRPEDKVGGHTEGHNAVSIGICAEGNFETETMGEAQREALRALVADVRTRYPSAQVIGHRDVSATACPGAHYPFDYIAGKSTTEAAASGIAWFQGWLNGSYKSGLVTDGIYGPKTKAAAVKACQSELNRQYGAGLVVDGMFGAKTKAAVRTLASGSAGSLVIILQGLLVCNGYDPGTIDGIYGAKTTAAVRAYQSAKGLAADGLAGKDTFTKLMS